MTSTNEDLLEKAAELLRSARHAVAFTGAGISTPSGVPDFRSQGSGLWERFDPMKVASVEVFQNHPERFYDWLRPLLQTTWNAQPNAAHDALARLETAGILKAVITQNIDDLHQRAGSKTVYEVHGSLRTLTCPHCRAVYPSSDFRQALEHLEADNGLPHCPSCSQILKPDIILFGETLPVDAWEQSEEHCRQADVMLVVGSSLEVYPAAALPEIAVEHRAKLIINNFTPTHLDHHAQAVFHSNVAEILPELVRRIL